MILKLNNEDKNKVLSSLNKLSDSINILLKFEIKNDINNRKEFHSLCERENDVIVSNISNITNIIINYRKNVIEDSLELTKKLFILNEKNFNFYEVEIPSFSKKIKDIKNKEDIYEEVSVNIELFKSLIKLSIADNDYYLNKINEIEMIRKNIHDINNKTTLISIMLLIKVLNKEISTNEIKKEEMFFLTILKEALDSINLLQKEYFN